MAAPPTRIVFWGAVLVAGLGASERCEVRRPGDPAKFVEPALRRGAPVIVRTASSPPLGAFVWIRDPKGGEEPLVSRVVALEGDEVELRGGKLVIGGRVAQEPYAHGHMPLESRPPIRVPRDHVYVLNDARGPKESGRADSRSLGPIALPRILGWTPGEAPMVERAAP